MLEFFKEGGFGMWPILVFGLITLVVAGRFAARPERRQLGFLGGMALSTVLVMLHATWTDFGTVCGALADPERVSDAGLTRTMWQGLKECTRPGAFGLALLTLAAILFAAGLSRMKREEDRAIPAPAQTA
jgi:hypothetical protein